MAEVRVQRRLAAILAADVVGYSRMMHANETRTRSLFNAHFNELLLPAIASHGGRVFKTMGDGLLAEFPSVVEAVECAAGVQTSMANRNAQEPDNSRFDFRIGVNIGDVIVEEDDVHGDGVNIAARLEAMAAPGGVFVSAEAVSQVAGKTDLIFEDLGEYQLKNIERPIKVHRVSKRDSSGSGFFDTGVPRPPPKQDTPSIAVLPFENRSREADQDYFSEGISEDLIAALGQIGWLFVIARSTSFAYARRAHDPLAVARELDVAYILGGTIRKAGNRVRISAELVDGQSGHRLWFDRFDRELADIFAIQDEISEAIAGAIEPALARSEQNRALANRSGDLRAWEIYQRAMWYSWKREREDLQHAIALFEQARAVDPSFALPFAGGAEAKCFQFIRGFSGDTTVLLEEAFALAQRAVALSSGDAYSRYVLGRTFLFMRRHEQAIDELELALEINPNSAPAHFALGNTLATSGHPQRGIVLLEKAMRLSPKDPQIGQMMARMAECYLFLDQCDEALSWARKSLQQPNIQPSRWATLVSILGHLERFDEIVPAREALVRLDPNYTIEFVKTRYPIIHEPSMQMLLAGLERAG